MIVALILIVCLALPFLAIRPVVGRIKERRTPQLEPAAKPDHNTRCACPSPERVPVEVPVFDGTGAEVGKETVAWLCGRCGWDTTAPDAIDALAAARNQWQQARLSAATLTAERIYPNTVHGAREAFQNAMRRADRLATKIARGSDGATHEVAGDDIRAYTQAVEDAKAYKANYEAVVRDLRRQRAGEARTIVRPERPDPVCDDCEHTSVSDDRGEIVRWYASEPCAQHRALSAHPNTWNVGPNRDYRLVRDWDRFTSKYP